MNATCDRHDNMTRLPPSVPSAPASSPAGFLAGVLAAGPLPANVVFDRGRAAGFSERTLNRAKRALAVRSVKGAFRGAWVWALPGPDAEGCHAAKGATTEPPKGASSNPSDGCQPPAGITPNGANPGRVAEPCQPPEGDDGATAAEGCQAAKGATLSDPDAGYEFEERAAILEFDGGLNRSDAEALARASVAGGAAAGGGG